MWRVDSCEVCCTHSMVLSVERIACEDWEKTLQSGSIWAGLRFYRWAWLRCETVLLLRWLTIFDVEELVHSNICSKPWFCHQKPISPNKLGSNLTGDNATIVSRHRHIPNHKLQLVAEVKWWSQITKTRCHVIVRLSKFNLYSRERTWPSAHQ